MLKKPKVLSAGDVVSLVATARQVNQNEMQFAKNFLTSYGLVVKEGKHLYNKVGGYFSAPDELRLNDLQDALTDKETKAILCARGGYGTTRIIDQLDFSQFQQSPKWLIGFSDITALHAALFNKGVQSIHGNMPISMSLPDADNANVSLLQILMDEHPQTIITWSGNNNTKQDQAEGTMAGGNLSLMVDSLGTKTEIKTDNCILVIEEIDEYHYKVDRMFNQLKRAGKLKRLAGLLIGYFTEIKQNVLPFHNTVEEIVLHYTKEYNYPVCFNFPSGHAQPNMPWIHGAQARIIISNENLTLQYI
ncbi:MAG: LD-carboxypeptidase [Cyclobacteriaceae bacterium]|jgi:muramoyltetrapeptide carboxypeptidase|nr:LD-carboxypeptidase [Cyclobacteriaceae bacterium]